MSGADEGFEIIEVRIVPRDEITTLYVLLGMDPKTEAVGGWWRKQVPPSVQAIPFILEELSRVGAFLDGWERGGPPGTRKRRTQST